MKNKLKIVAVSLLWIAGALGSSQASEPVSAGAYHVVALKQNGAVWAWGDNSNAQLANGSTDALSTTPVHVTLPGGLSATGVSAGGYHTLAVLSDGSVAAFGRNDEGELGNGGTGSGPVLANGLSNVTAVAAGGFHSAALKSDGTVWTWGVNSSGQLGNGTTNNSSVPVQVTTLTNVTAISAGLYSTYALKADGTVWAWGANGNNQLGDGTSNDSSVPVQVGTLSGVIAISGGYYHATALKSDGTVWSWGYGWNGQLGDNTVYFGGGAATPVQASGITTATKVAAGSFHTAVVLSDGSLWAFGSNWTGQLGNGQTWVNSILPYPQASIVTSGAQGVVAGNDTTFVLKSGGDVTSFGYNEFGQQGYGELQGKLTPTNTGVSVGANGKVAGGAFHLAVRTSTSSVAWVGYYATQSTYIGGVDPYDENYQLQAVASLTNATAIASGDHHTLVLKQDKTVWAFGVGWNGQLGDGNFSTSMEPVQVSGLTNVAAISAAGNTSLAVTEDGKLYTWGSNLYQSDGSIADSGTPVDSSMSGVVRAAAGDKHIVASTTAGIWIWGINDRQQLSSSTASVLLTPTQVSTTLTNASAIVAGNGYSMVLQAGKVYSWGVNDYGQLGQGSTSVISSPTLISGLNTLTISEIVAGDYHALARTSTRQVRGWGLNNVGQVGDGSTDNKLSPVPVISSGVNSIGAGYLHSAAVLTTGALVTWGNNGNSQLALSVASEHAVLNLQQP